MGGANGMVILVDKEQWSLLTKAALMDDLSVEDFVLNAALTRARAHLTPQVMIELSERDFDHVVSMLNEDEPPEISAEVAARYRRGMVWKKE